MGRPPKNNPGEPETKENEENGVVEQQVKMQGEENVHNTNITKKQLTSEEQAIFDRVSKSDADWDAIKEEDMLDFSLARDVYALPPEAKKRQDNKEYAFRCIEMTDKRIDQVTNWPAPLRWWICNRSTAPFLKGYFHPSHGGVQLEDQLLVMKPWHMHQLVQDKKRELSDAKNKAGDIAEKDGKEREDGKAEYVAGKQHKISSSDIVMAEASDF